jgi:hypothetical protein
MYPLVVFAKLVDDVTMPGNDVDVTAHDRDPQGVTPQGSIYAPVEPIVVLQALTLYNDSLYQTAGLVNPIPLSPTDAISATDHVTVLARPSVICFNPNAIDTGGILVTPFAKGPDPSALTVTCATAADCPGGDTCDNQKCTAPILDPATVQGNVPRQIRKIEFACLPKGRYEVNVVYPTGQAWTIPNEAGTCGGTEGVTDYSNMDDFPNNLTCTVKPRKVLYSQGNRAVLEIVGPSDPSNCVQGGTGVPAVPDECLPCNQRQNPASFGECAGN